MHSIFRVFYCWPGLCGQITSNGRMYCGQWARGGSILKHKMQFWLINRDARYENEIFLLWKTERPRYGSFSENGHFQREFFVCCWKVARYFFLNFYLFLYLLASFDNSYRNRHHNQFNTICVSIECFFLHQIFVYI